MGKTKSNLESHPTGTIIIMIKFNLKQRMIQVHGEQYNLKKLLLESSKKTMKMVMKELRKFLDYSYKLRWKQTRSMVLRDHPNKILIILKIKKKIQIIN